MARVRVSTTVDKELLQTRRVCNGKPDSALIDEALEAFLTRHRAAEVDARYAAYDDTPSMRPMSGETWRRSGRLRPLREPPLWRGVVVRVAWHWAATRSRPVSGCSHRPVATGRGRARHLDDPGPARRSGP